MKFRKQREAITKGKIFFSCGDAPRDATHHNGIPCLQTWEEVNADTIYRIWEHVKYPELAEVLSSPWYTDIIFFGIVTAVIVGFCLLFRWIIRKRDD